MKRALTIILALSLAMAMAAFGEDSPMVAAAKRANRKGKKPTNVITNETLAKSGGNAHVTTTAKQAPFVAPKPYIAPSPTPEMVALRARDAERRRAAAQASAQAKTGEQQQARSEAAAAAAEEGLYDDVDIDPAQAEKTQHDTNQKPPQR